MNNFGIGNAISFGFTVLSKNAGSVLLAGLFYLLITFGAAMLTELIKLTTESIFIALLLDLIYFLITVWLMLGWAKFALKAFNGETLNPADILSQTDKILAGFAAYLLYTIIVVIGMLLLIVPGLYLASRLFFFDYFIVEKGMGPIGALGASWQLAEGNVLNVFGLLLLAGLIAGAGLLVCGIGIIVTVPPAMIAYGYAYKKLQGEQEFVGDIG